MPAEDTAFGHRGTMFEYVAAASWTDPAEDHDRMTLTRRYAAVIGRFASGVYVNTLTDRDQGGLRRAYSPAKLARLAAVKRSYDPGNVFHLNHNIAPAAGSGRPGIG